MRRSVFDLLKEKYPDLAPSASGKKAPAAKAPEPPPKPDPPKPAPAAARPAPPVAAPSPVAAPPPKRAMPAPRLETRKPEPPRSVPPKNEPSQAKPALPAAPAPTPPAIAEAEPKPLPVVAAPAPPAIAEAPVAAAPVAEAPVAEAPQLGQPEPPKGVAPADEPPPAVALPMAAPSPPAAEVDPFLEAALPATPFDPAPRTESPAPAAALREPPPAAAPAAARKHPAPEPRAKRAPSWRRRLPSRQVVAFWSGAALLLVLGAYGLAHLKPVLAPAAKVAALPGDSGAEAQSVNGLSLEPEKVVVPVPGDRAKADPRQSEPPKKPDPRKPDPQKPDPKKSDSKKSDPKKSEPSKADSSIVIETVPPVLPPVRTGGRQPEYPVEARAAGIEGTVVLFGVIDKSGKVKSPRVVRSLSPPLDAAALAAFRTWRFKPATQKGKKVEFKYNAGIEFRINSPAEQVAATPEPEPETPAVAAPAPAALPALLPYGGDFTPPVRVTMVWPQKPQGAQMVKGEVRLQLAVGADGAVQAVEVLEGLPQGVTEAAIEAVRQWKFKPARRAGEPVAVYHRVSLRF